MITPVRLSCASLDKIRSLPTPPGALCFVFLVVYKGALLGFIPWCMDHFMKCSKMLNDLVMGSFEVA
ncbi:hypothetical protein MRB53_019192 [Persea americana]|uniref:Uncharacterized protein n=1 Tax=Persea americana TaxID=3435 RepID=A0ACC2KXT6_PERAE|nr:hypothetical protein MRB53_019192 [Persea americana]